MKKRLEGAALKLPPGLTRPGSCKPEFWKMTSQPTFFCCVYFLKNVIKLHRLFYVSNINTHFDMFFKIKACIGIIYFLVCVRKHKSNLSTNICTTVGKKTQWYRSISVEKCELLSETTFSLYFMTVWCVFFYQSVYYFTNGVYHVFITTVCVNDYCKTVLVKKYTQVLPRYDLLFPIKCHKFYTGFYVVV